MFSPRWFTVGCTLAALLGPMAQSFVLPRTTHVVPSTSSKLCDTNNNKGKDKDDMSMMIVQEGTTTDPITTSTSTTSTSSSSKSRRNVVINTIAGGLLAACGVAAWELYRTTVYTPTGFTRLPSTQFIAALGNPAAQQGTDAKAWGLWRQDPGPRGVWLRDYQKELVQSKGVAPRGWKFDPDDFWVEEHGLIMESPQFPLPPGRYLVTGARSVTTGLTVQADGTWKLDQGTLYDVTHLPCRSARYNPVNNASGSPAAARLSDFPVQPGAEMPPIPGTKKQDYAVLFLIGKAAS